MLIGGGLILFLFSFDDFVTSFFLTGPGPPLPVFIYGMIRFGVTPEINAIGCLMITASVVLGGASALIMRKRY